MNADRDLHARQGDVPIVTRNRGNAMTERHAWRTI